MGKQEDFVLRALEERDVRFVRLWFTDVLGFLKSVSVAPAELENAFEEGIGFDGSAIEGFARVYESDMLAHPDAVDVPDPALAHRRGRRPGDGPHVLRHRDARRQPVVRRPATRPQAHAERGRRQGVHLLHPPRDRVLPVQGRAREGRRAGAGGPQRVLRPHRAVARRRLPPRGDHDARGDGHLGGVQPPRGRPGPAGDRPALRRRAHHRRQHHDLPHRHPGGRARPGHLGLLHAQAVHRRTRARACTPTCRSSRATATPSSRPARSTSCPRPAGSSSPASCATPARSASSPTSGSTPTSGSSAAARRPSCICWGHNNRSAMVRVPMYKPNKGQSTRIELRTIDAACNPYLAFAVILAAGMKGIEEGYELPREAEDDVWSLTERERKALGISPLPQEPVRRDRHRRGLRAARRDAGRARLRLLPAQQARGVGGVPQPGLRLRARPDAAGPLSPAVLR